MDEPDEELQKEGMNIRVCAANTIVDRHVPHFARGLLVLIQRPWQGELKQAADAAKQYLLARPARHRIWLNMWKQLQNLELSFGNNFAPTTPRLHQHHFARRGTASASAAGAVGCCLWPHSARAATRLECGAVAEC